MSPQTYSQQLTLKDSSCSHSQMGHVKGLLSSSVRWDCILVAGTQSHTVNHISGPVTYISDLASQTVTHSYTGTSSAVRHRSDQLPLIQHGVEGLHCAQVCVAIVTTHCKDFAHHCGNPDATPGSGKCCHIIPPVASRVVPFH